MEPKRRRGRPRTFKREPIVQRALQHYWSDGPRSLSVNEICRRVGLSKPSLYREFGGEDGLHDAALQSYAAQVLAPLGGRMADAGSFVAATEIILGFISSTANGCLLAKLRLMRGGLGPLTGARVDAMTGALQAAYGAIIARGVQSGELRADLPPDLATRYLDTQIGTAVRLVAAGEPIDEVLELTRLALTALQPAE